MVKPERAPPSWPRETRGQRSCSRTRIRSDGLHQKAGLKEVLELHGSGALRNLLRARRKLVSAGVTAKSYRILKCRVRRHYCRMSLYEEASGQLADQCERGCISPRRIFLDYRRYVVMVYLAAGLIDLLLRHVGSWLQQVSTWTPCWDYCLRATGRFSSCNVSQAKLFAIQVLECKLKGSFSMLNDKIALILSDDYRWPELGILAFSPIWSRCCGDVPARHSRIAYTWKAGLAAVLRICRFIFHCDDTTQQPKS